MDIKQVINEVKAASISVQQRCGRIIGTTTDDVVGKSLTRSDELLLSLQDDDSFENFLLVHGEFMQLLVNEYHKATNEESRDEIAGLIAEFYSIKRLIVPFVTGDNNDLALSPETGQIQ